MSIKNKSESLSLINSLHLNTMGEEIFTCKQNKELKKWLWQHQSNSYILRDKTKVLGKVYYNLTKSQVLKKVIEYKIFSIDESFEKYQNHKLLIGEILVDLDFKLKLTASTNIKSNHRHLLEPMYYMDTDIFDEKLKYIPGYEELIDYVFKYELFNYIIEFVVFDMSIGRNKEKVLVLELRDSY